MSRLSYSNFFVREQRQRSGSRFWMRRVTKEEKDRERQTRKDTMKPLKNYFGGSGWNKNRLRGTRYWTLEEFSERWHISIICRENDCLSKQRTIQRSSMSHFFPSFVLPAIVLKIIRHINHVDISLFPPRVHRCHMLSRARPFVFQGALGK